MPESICGLCGGANPVWSADNDLHFGWQVAHWDVSGKAE